MSTIAGLGAGAEVERIARRIVQDGQITAWRYTVTRAPDGGTRLATGEKVAVPRQERLLIEPYAASLPVSPPPMEWRGCLRCALMRRAGGMT